MNERFSTDMLTYADKVTRELSEAIQKLEQSHELHERVKVFEATIWFRHLQAQVNGTRARGMSAACRGVKVMTWCCAGRCLIQLERDGQRITLVTVDDEECWERVASHVAPPMGPMGIQSIDAEFVESLKMLYTATRYGYEIELEPDETVTIG